MDILSIDEKFVWHPFTPTPHKGPKEVFTKGEGSFLIAANGKRYLDATSSWWCNLHGHCHPRLVSAIAEQAKTLDQILFAPHTHPVAAELSKKLVSTLGEPFQRVFYSDDGSTAVEAALKMSVQYWQNMGEPQRRYFLSVEGGYHGDTLGAVSVGYVEEFHHFFDQVMVPSMTSTMPYCYRCPLSLSYPSCKLACLDKAKRLISEKGNQIAALIVEPLILGAEGMVAYPAAYLEALVRLCREYGILVIFDEVFTGFGRTGTFFAMDQLAKECRPDIVCLSKGLTGGMLPMGATVASERVFEPFRGKETRKFYHGHTFSANAIGCRVALENLLMFEEQSILERNQKWIAKLAEQKERFLQLSHVGDVRHLGMIWAAELVLDKSTKRWPKPPNGPGWSIANALWQKGIWLRPLQNIVYFVPPYSLTEDEFNLFFESLYHEVSDDRHF